MFQSTIFFLKGTSFALLVSCQIQTLASPWSNSVVPKSGVLFTGSLFCSPKSLVYITRCCIGQRYRQRTQRASCVSSMLAIAITLNGGIRVNVVGSGKGAKSSARQRRSRGLSGQGVVWDGWGLICASLSLDTRVEGRFPRRTRRPNKMLLGLGGGQRGSLLVVVIGKTRSVVPMIGSPLRDRWSPGLPCSSEERGDQNA